MSDYNILNLSDIDRGYIAGILDGEGCLNINLYVRKSGSVIIRQRISIGMTNKDLIYWLKDITGLGSVHQCKTRGNRKTSYTWTLSDNQSVQLLLSIMDCLRVKQQQAKLMLELSYLRNQTKSGTRERFEFGRQVEIYWEMKNLNKKGVELSH